MEQVVRAFGVCEGMDGDGRWIGSMSILKPELWNLSGF